MAMVRAVIRTQITNCLFCYRNGNRLGNCKICDRKMPKSDSGCGLAAGASRPQCARIWTLSVNSYARSGQTQGCNYS
jgi:hypothetical protein